MQQNPFAPHSPAPPDAFIDRQREVDLVFGHILAAQRGNVAISGPLGSGKTSLLRHIADPAVASQRGVTYPEFALVYLDIQSVAPFSASKFWHRIAQMLDRMPGSHLAEPIDGLMARDEPDFVDLEEFVDGLADRGTTLVLLLDEFEWVLQVSSAEAEAASRDFLATLASLARRTPRALCLMVATESPLPEVTRVIGSWRGSPFPTIFIATTLRPFDRQEVGELLDRALGAERDLLSSEDCDLLYRATGGYPAALQAAAFALFQHRDSNVTAEELREAAQNAAVQALATLTQREQPEDSPPEKAPDEDAEMPDDGLWIDSQTGDVFVDRRRVESLTALEYNLLRLLYANAGRLCSKEEIIHQVWGSEFVGQIDDSRVEKLVSRLRRKIEPVPGRPQYVRTVRGRGYRFVP